MVMVCQRLASSTAVSIVTALLTIYALLGDDLRLYATDKTADDNFNTATLVCMSIFGVEIFINVVGQNGYLFGFFFTLDVLSTITLLLDVTWVSEELFGDSISVAEQYAEGQGAPMPASGSPGSGGNSADAARAARMSRAGTKAGRVVRLLRLVRLIRLVKFYNRSSQASKSDANDGNNVAPGVEWEDDDDDGPRQESAVSKKLSEMTTRRVTMLVLVIMLSLPFFQPTMYNDKLPSSAQYGANMLYRRWRDDMEIYKPWSNSSTREIYLESKGREIYVDDFLMYAYYHSPFTDEDRVPDSAIGSPLGSFGKLFYLGISPTNSDSAINMGEFFLPSFDGRGSNSPAYDPNQRWSGEDWLYYQGNFTDDPMALLSKPWETTESCLKGYVRGTSILEQDEPDLVCPETIRYNERSVVVPTAMTSDEYKELHFIFVFDRRTGSQLEALLNMAQTLFICFLLGFGAMTFSQDANRLVLTPIERMISKLDKIRNNPLEAMTIGDEEHHREQVKAASGNNESEEGAKKVSWWSRWLKSRAPKNTPEPMETVVLEKTIIKIGSLLALGFGEAGAEIIGQNMRGGDSSALNAMIPGRKVEAIFGFCDIRNFTDAMEVLQDQVMVFVNRIAAVIHSCVNEFFGNPNKNIGDAFLMAWRLSGHCPKKQQKLADMAMISFIKIIAQINKSPLLAEYRNHPKLVKRLPNYRVRMGFGLHSGWAIEGAIGSEFKIDASYLSPNVNMAARLEAVTKQYGCLILMTDAIIQLMSEEVAEECRIIDHVRLSGTKDPFKLYTCDLNDLALEVDRPHGSKEPSDGANVGKTLSAVAGSDGKAKSTKFRQRQERLKIKQERWSDDFWMHSMFTNDPDLNIMRSKFTPEFFCRFDMAYLNYEAGEWSVAKDMLEVTRFLLATEDGPSAALLRFMKAHETANGEAPQGWPGYRVLNQKGHF